MNELGTALTKSAVKVMMLGSGELGKEVVIEFQRLGVEVVAVDRYENAPAMQVAHRSYMGAAFSHKQILPLNLPVGYRQSLNSIS